jgi:ketosteroid isomerase-like protein
MEANLRGSGFRGTIMQPSATTINSGGPLMQQLDERQDEAAEVRELLKTCERSLNTSDTELAVSCYAEDGIFMPTAAPTAQGAGLRPAYAQIFDTIELRVSFTIDELVIASPTVAHALTRSQGTQTILATKATTPEANREVFIFIRDRPGWKISRYMFNKTE